MSRSAGAKFDASGDATSTRPGPGALGRATVRAQISGDEIGGESGPRDPLRERPDRSGKGVEMREEIAPARPPQAKAAAQANPITLLPPVTRTSLSPANSDPRDIHVPYREAAKNSCKNDSADPVVLWLNGLEAGFPLAAGGLRRC